MTQSEEGLLIFAWSHSSVLRLVLALSYPKGHHTCPYGSTSVCHLLTPNYISVTSKTSPVSYKVGTSPFGCLQWDTVNSSNSGCLKHGSCCFIAPEVCFSLLLPYLGKFPSPVQSPKPKPGCLAYLFPHCPPSDPPELLNLISSLSPAPSPPPGSSHFIGGTSLPTLSHLHALFCPALPQRSQQHGSDTNQTPCLPCLKLTSMVAHHS